ncbi:hypothetical protein BGW38_002767 [Lunasporangiospora selenospora]|uniref:Glycosyltransferase family 24 protein n=1 Tax=Lunasporangiospora selenospora TaxID=979761 RepID=A0A9P6G5U1_9FUNG|nr:hypothetical protein BGW38_002767 [Lunasporangiospora selenospora]
MRSTAPWIEAHYHLYNATVVPDKKARWTGSSGSRAFDESCAVWVDWYDRQICSAQEMLDVIQKGLGSYRNLESQVTFMELDHALSPNAKDPELFAVLYADVFDPEFAKLQQVLDELTRDHALRYSVRYRPSARTHRGLGEEKLWVAGYGVELALKSTDYIVIDDRDLGTGDEDGEDASSGQTVFSSRTHQKASGSGLFKDEDKAAPAVEQVHQSDLGGLGLATTQFILQSENPLNALVTVAQDYPKYQARISKTPIGDELKFATRNNLMSLRGDGRSKVWLNNQPIPHHKMNPFNLLRLLRREREVISSLATMGITTQKAVDLLTDFGSTETDHKNGPAGSEKIEGVFDVRDKSEQQNLVVWLNDLEKDLRYNDWSPSLTQLLRPVFNGQFHNIRRNVINSLFVLDLSSPQAMELVSFELPNYVQRLVPFRFGILPLVQSEDGEDAKIAMLWRHVVGRHGIKGGLELLKKTLISHVQEGVDIPTAIQKSFAAATALPKLKSTEIPELSYDQVLASDSAYRTAWLPSVRAMQSRIGITGASHFVNGKYFAWEGDHGQQLMSEVASQTSLLANRLIQNELPSSETLNVYDYFMTLPGVFARRNPFIFVGDENPLKVVDLAFNDHDQVIFVDRLSYFASASSEHQCLTVHVIADFDTLEGQTIALEAVKSLENVSSDERSPGEEVRMAFIQNGKGLRGQASGKDTAPSDATFGQFVLHSSITATALPVGFWKSLLQDVVDAGPSAGSDVFSKSFRSAAEKYPDVGLITFGTEGREGIEEENDSARRQFLERVLDGKYDSQRAVLLVNGRLVGPIAETFNTEDFHLLYAYEKNARGDKIKTLLANANIKDDARNIMKVTSVVVKASLQMDQGLYDLNEAVVTRDRSFESLNLEQSGFTVNPTAYAENDDSLFLVTAVLDPVSKLTQQWAAILKTLSEMDHVKVQVVLLPAMETSEVAIKRFYRYVSEPELRFDNNGNLARPSAYFSGLPETALLTLGVDVNPAWVVSPKICIHDLDNLLLSSLTGESARRTGVQAEFELQHVLIEGFSRDITLRTTSKGAQFILGTKTEPHVVDTLVMANMGYFQLKGLPGVWEMQLRPGRTSQVYGIESIGSEGWEPGFGPVKNEKRHVVISNFEGLVLYPRLVRNPGMQQADINEEVVQESGIWDSIKSTIKGLAQPLVAKGAKPKAEINIFSVASGHLYERFLSIMILSVIKNTQSRVKFWFIENFLSPSFKDLIPLMAEKYDFDYELVTYNWPHWLRAQTEKQRIIWAYKILFLDVLFPLDLDKVIFVDADQVVRTDMKELVDMDLHGAPYGYTPMCQDRKEMEGFRFWNQGYWKEHLKTKPYHISALYVVDLFRFRQMQAGDRLRNHYQQLSRDPNSLANLDQDLPNNMQNEVPIFSLPQEWLWCETWCGDEGLTKAKTIDLCNNPLTKEPKLDRARRQIKEWESLDDEATEFAKKVHAQLKVARRSEKGPEQEQKQGQEKQPTQHQAQGTDASESAEGESHARKDEL